MEELTIDEVLQMAEQVLREARELQEKTLEECVTLVAVSDVKNGREKHLMAFRGIQEACPGWWASGEKAEGEVIASIVMFKASDAYRFLKESGLIKPGKELRSENESK